MTTAIPPLRWFTPAAGDGGGVVILHDDRGITEGTELVARELVDAGLVAVIPDLLARWGGDPERASDGFAMLDVAAAREALVARTSGRAYVVGIGLGGTWALMALSAVSGFSAGVVFQPRLSYPSLCERHPTQPLDLLPGVRCPIQAHFAELDPDVPVRHVESLRERLERSPACHQLFVYPGVRRGFLDPTDPAWHEASARSAVSRARRFLERIRVQ